jgi:hypothetical protein
VAAATVLLIGCANSGQPAGTNRAEAATGAEAAGSEVSEEHGSDPAAASAAAQSDSLEPLSGPVGTGGEGGDTNNLGYISEAIAAVL